VEPEQVLQRQNKSIINEIKKANPSATPSIATVRKTLMHHTVTQSYGGLTISPTQAALADNVVDNRKVK